MLVGLKSDLRNDPATIRELKGRNQTPVTYEEGKALAASLMLEQCIECSGES